MNRRIAALAVLLAAAIAVAACGGNSSPTVSGVMERQRAVDFKLSALDGTEISLAGYRGSVVLLNFWASWCGPCKAEMPDIQQAYQADRDKGLVVLGINARESPGAVKAFIDDLGLTFPILMDARGQVFAQYRGSGLPMTIIVDRDGVIQVRHLGYMSAGTLHKYLARLGIK